jgi:hypothetical protein
MTPLSREWRSFTKLFLAQALCRNLRHPYPRQPIAGIIIHPIGGSPALLGGVRSGCVPSLISAASTTIASAVSSLVGVAALEYADATPSTAAELGYFLASHCVQSLSSCASASGSECPSQSVLRRDCGCRLKLRSASLHPPDTSW